MQSVRAAKISSRDALGNNAQMDVFGFLCVQSFIASKGRKKGKSYMQRFAMGSITSISQKNPYRL